MNSVEAGPVAPRALPWQQAAWSAAWQQLQARRLPHAVMIEGTPGTGRERFAEAFAAALLCEAPGDAGACGQCRACALVAAGSHPDLQRITPAEEGKAIGVDAIRAAIAFVVGTSSLGSRKVLLVRPAERLTIAAFNAFLKCLEEPTPGTVILLVSARGHPIPATIRSRCQRWCLPTPSRRDALDWLAGEGAAERDGATLDTLLALAGGRPLAVQTMLEDGSAAAVETLHRAIDTVVSSEKRQVTAAIALALEDAAAAVGPDRLLDILELGLQDWLRTREAAALRSPHGQAAFRGLDTLRGLRRARRAGSNPNPDLLRFRALEAFMAARGA